MVVTPAGEPCIKNPSISAGINLFDDETTIWLNGEFRLSLFAKL